MKNPISWPLLSILALIMILGVFRIGISGFFQNPEIKVPDQTDEPYSVSPRGAFVLEFSHRMKKGSVERYLRLNPQIPFSSSWKGRTFFIKPKINLDPFRFFRVSVGMEAQSFFGVGFLHDQEFQFQVSEEPHVEGIANSDFEKDVPPHRLSVLFSHPMVSEALVEKQILPDAFLLTPSPSGRWSWPNTKTLVFTTDEGFAPETKYHFRNVKPLLSLDLSPLQGNVDVSFDTPPRKVTEEEVEDQLESKPDQQEELLSASFLRWKGDPSFFTISNRSEDLTARFQSLGISELVFEACELSLESMVRIEARTLRQWASFKPSKWNCRSFESTVIQNTSLSELTDHAVSLADVFPKISKGLYYVRVSTPDDESDEETAFIDGVFEYSSLAVFSKRGLSGLVWVINESGRVVPEAKILLYSHSGSLLEISRTDVNGLFFLPQNRLQYEYLAVTSRNETIFFDILRANDFDPRVFGITRNQEENPYQFQVLLEDQDDPHIFRGVFILKKDDFAKLLPPDIRFAQASLLTSDETVLDTKRFPVDFLGNLFFELKLPREEVQDPLFLSFCAGLFDGICLGTNFWTLVEQKEEPAEEIPEEGQHEPDPLDLIREVELDADASSITVMLQNLTPELPFLLTVERDLIFSHQVRFPSASTDTVLIPLVASMVPEVMITVTQSRGKGFVYSMKEHKIPLSLRKISALKDPNNPSVIRFLLDPFLPPFSEENFLSAWYPERGTSLATTATKNLVFRPRKVISKTQDSSLSEIFLQRISGTLMPPEIKNVPLDTTKKMLNIIHDEEGNFGVFEEDPRGHQIVTSIDIPFFVRPADHLLLDLKLKNMGSDPANLELITEGNGSHTQSEKSLLVGVPGNLLMTIPIPFTLNARFSLPQATFDLGIFSGGELVASKREQIPLPPLFFGSRKLLLKKEFEEADHEFSIPLRKEEKPPVLEVLLSPSPVSFILPSFSMLFEKPQYFLKDDLLLSSLVQVYDPLLGRDEKKQSLRKKLLDLLQNRDIFRESMTDLFWITEALTFSETAQNPLPEEFRKTLITYWRKNLDVHFLPEGPTLSVLKQKTPSELYDLTLALKSLASLTPSGIPAANLLFSQADWLPQEALLMLLLAFEHYRDYGVTGIQFKIEDLIQMLNEKVGNLPLRDMQTASFYLKALVSQASARLEIPNVLQWMVERKYRPEYQSVTNQYAFLSATASYLKLYREKITASTLELSSEGEILKTFSFDPKRKFQSFSFLLPLEAFGQDKDSITLRLRTDAPQSLFIEASTREEVVSPGLSQGISVLMDIDLSQRIQKGDLVVGEIVILNPEARRHVVVSQALPAGVKAQLRSSFDETYHRFRVRNDQIDYVFDEIPAGIIKIPFVWEAEWKGVFQVPPIILESKEDFSIRASSEDGEITIY